MPRKVFTGYGRYISFSQMTLYRNLCLPRLLFFVLTAKQHQSCGESLVTLIRRGRYLRIQEVQPLYKDSWLSLQYHAPETLGGDVSTHITDAINILQPFTNVIGICWSVEL